MFSHFLILWDADIGVLYSKLRTEGVKLEIFYMITLPDYTFAMHIGGDR